MQSLIPQDVDPDGNCWYRSVAACIRSDSDLSAAFENRADDHSRLRHFVADLALLHGRDFLSNLIEQVTILPDLIQDYPFLTEALDTAIRANIRINDATEAVQLISDACRKDAVWASQFEISLMNDALSERGVRQVIVTLPDDLSFASKSCQLEYDLMFALDAEDVKQRYCIILLRLDLLNHYQWIPFRYNGVVVISDLLSHLEQVLDSTSVDQSFTLSDTEADAESGEFAGIDFADEENSAKPVLTDSPFEKKMEILRKIGQVLKSDVETSTQLI